jgi:photosystem II stability/assembly factor-like uncharacterized protein
MIFSILPILSWLASLWLPAKQNSSVQLLTIGQNTSIRGMSIPSDQVIWVSGSNGTIGKSVDAGKTWRWIIAPGLEKRDFRDIEAFDSSTAIAMAVDNPAIIVKTTNGGVTWKKVFEREMPGMFLDAMDFKNKKEGICIGDPLTTGQTKTKQFYIIRTFDGGDTWKEISVDKKPSAQPGEAIFAASGTNIFFLNNPDFEYGFVTGGAVSNLYFIARQQKQNLLVKIPVVQGKETAGAFSMAADRRRNIYCIGGDYKSPENSTDNYRYSKTAGGNWDSAAKSSPSGYRSCIRIIKDKTLVACGPTGVDFAQNGQKEWKKVSAEGFNVCMVSKGKQVFLAGEKGKIGRLIY